MRLFLDTSFLYLLLRPPGEARPASPGEGAQRSGAPLKEARPASPGEGAQRSGAPLKEARPALRRWLEERRGVLQGGRDQAVVSPLVFDELAYRLLLAFLKDAGERDALTRLRADGEGVLRKHGPRVALLLEQLAALPGLRVVPVSAAALASTLRIMVRFALLPRDACHVAVAAEARCDAIVSLDDDFGRSSDLVAWIGPP